MTLLEKIKNYKWFDSPNKLRTILEELYNSIGGGSGGGGGDLQSVLNAGNYAGVSEEFSYIQLLGGNIQDRNVEVSITNADFSAGSNLNMSNNHAILSNSGNNTTGALSIDSGEVTLKQNVTNDSTKRIEVGFEDPIGSAYLNFPAKTAGTYTIATTADILHINLDSRVYATNAAAISGGLTTNDVYRTATGELRVVR